MSTKNAALLVTAAASALFAAVLPAQQLVHASQQSWSRTYGGPYWTRKVADSRADFRVVDRLNYVWWLDSKSPAIRLYPGTYVASARLMKFGSMSGAQPLDFFTTIDGRTSKVTLPVSAQKLDTFVNTPNLVFDVSRPTTIRLHLRNINTRAIKRRYLFDSFRIGKVGLAVDHYVGFANDMTHTHGKPYWTDSVRDRSSALGTVDKLNHVWWLNYGGSITLPAGSYVINARVKKTVSTVGRYDLEVLASENGRTHRNVLRAAAQPVDRWVHTPELTFRLSRSTKVSLALRNLDTRTIKRNYLFDAFAIRRAAFKPYGQSCKGSRGTPRLSGGTPRIGRGFYAAVAGARPFTRGSFYIGFAPRARSLDVLGAKGCMFYTDRTIALPISTDSNGYARISFPIPNNPWLIGKHFFGQSLVLDRGANPSGLVMTNAGRALIGR